MKLTKGTILRTRGGWDAEVVAVSALHDGFYAIHQPDTGQASGPIFHWPDGTAHAVLAVYNPPVYNGHPADLEMGEYEL